MDRERLTRLAPTPSGYLHWGNAFSFVLTWLHAQHQGARILLRIDDLDAQRKRAAYVEDIFRSLDWLGLGYDLGPTGPDDFEANYSQRHRHSLYEQHLRRLIDDGELFACRCTRKEILASPGQVHPATCQYQGVPLEANDVCWRLATSPFQMESWNDLDGTHHAVDVHQSMRDPVVRRKGGLAAYQLASLIDDTHFGVNLVVRGEDLIDSTAVQRWISRRLPDATFHDAVLLHHPLVKDTEGQKLSKSRGAASLLDMRIHSSSPAPLYRQLSPLLGLPEPVDTLQQAREQWLELQQGQL